MLLQCGSALNCGPRAYTLLLSLMLLVLLALSAAGGGQKLESVRRAHLLLGKFFVASALAAQGQEHRHKLHLVE